MAAAGGPKSRSLIANGYAGPESPKLFSWLKSFGVLSGCSVTAFRNRRFPEILGSRAKLRTHVAILYFVPSSFNALRNAIDA